MSIYKKFTIKQLGEGYKYHAQQDCEISQHMAKEILDELVARKGQRAAKIRNAFDVQTHSDDTGLWIYEDADSEPMCRIDRNKEVQNTYAPEWLFNALEYLA